MGSKSRSAHQQTGFSPLAGPGLLRPRSACRLQPGLLQLQAAGPPRGAGLCPIEFSGSARAQIPQLSFPSAWPGRADLAQASDDDPVQLLETQNLARAHQHPSHPTRQCLAESTCLSHIVVVCTSLPEDSVLQDRDGRAVCGVGRARLGLGADPGHSSGAEAAVQD